MSKTVRSLVFLSILLVTWAWSKYALARDTATWDDEEEIVTLTDRKSDWCDDKKKTDAPRDFVEVEWRAAKRYDKSTKVTTAACWTFSPEHGVIFVFTADGRHTAYRAEMFK